MPGPIRSLNIDAKNEQPFRSQGRFNVVGYTEINSKELRIRLKQYYYFVRVLSFQTNFVWNK
jgi:hypothetical protein